MIKKILSLLIVLIFTGCTTLKEKMPTRKTCTDEKDTLADVFCKKD